MTTETVVSVDLTSEQAGKLFSGLAVIKPMRKRPVSNVVTKLDAELPDVLKALVGAMAEAGYMTEDIQQLVAEHLAKPAHLR